ncbi:MAG: hypothetical protein IMZ53_01605 [Thermoplasmata archaeon]|nr:hypothetical protein [Thermoplasmata archaeon]
MAARGGACHPSYFAKENPLVADTQGPVRDGLAEYPSLAPGYAGRHGQRTFREASKGATGLLSERAATNAAAASAVVATRDGQGPCLRSPGHALFDRRCHSNGARQGANSSVTFLIEATGGKNT